PFCADPAPCVLCELEAGDSHYQLPLGYLSMAEADQNAGQAAAAFAVARLRRGPRSGLLTDAATLAGFTRQVLAAMGQGHGLGSGSQQIAVLPAPDLDAEDLAEEEIHALPAGHSTTAVLIGERMMLKIIRNVMPGVHPETEIGRFLARRQS